ncbi:MAG TPA: ABC transporter permease [Thermoanaerobaculia bacterium]|nr:ABC transporter permease [Thermoanaerobaculia bacterium]
MRLEKTLVLARREYLSRVKTKGFWIGIFLLPVVMGALFVVPALVMSKTGSDTRLTLVDDTGLGTAVAEHLAERQAGNGMGTMRFDVTVAEPAADPAAQQRELDQRLLDEEIDAWVRLTPEAVAAGEVEFRARNVANAFTQEVIADAISDVIRQRRLGEAGFSREQADALIRGVDLDTIRVSAEGSRSEAGAAGFFLAYGLFFLLYMVLLIWGQQVLQGVLEEKSSRVVEVIVSSARPFDLMFGKLLGIGAAALTQFGVWMATLVALSAPGLLTSFAFLSEIDNLPRITIAQALYVVIFFVLGFFVYSSMYAAVGAAFNSLQEAQNFASVPTLAIVSPLFFLMPVINDSGSTLAVVLSMIPLLSPILMPLRIAVELPPVWQIWLSIAITAIFVVLMVWLASRIYRIGILMYGKKPTVQELWRWLRYA